jgi:hypothetical protein
MPGPGTCVRPGAYLARENEGAKGPQSQLGTCSRASWRTPAQSAVVVSDRMTRLFITGDATI